MRTDARKAVEIEKRKRWRTCFAWTGRYVWCPNPRKRGSLFCSSHGHVPRKLGVGLGWAVLTSVIGGVILVFALSGEPTNSRGEPTLTASSQDAESRLRSLLDQLDNAARDYDDGWSDAAASMASLLYQLLVDPYPQYAPLTELEMKDRMFFVNSAERDPQTVDEGNFSSPYVGLCGLSLGSGTLYVPHRKEQARLRANESRLRFTRWWDSIIIDDRLGTTMTRRELALAMAAESGYGEVSPELERKYFEISSRNSRWWEGLQRRGNETIIGSPSDVRATFCSIRQIAWELLESLPATYSLRIVSGGPPRYQGPVFEHLSISDTLTIGPSKENPPP